MSRPTDFIPFYRPSIDREEEEAVLSVLRSGWLTTGEVTLQFEREFAARAGVDYALAVSSATAGLHLCLEAAGVGEHGKVATTPYTFAATAEVIRYLGADPLFVDIEEDSYNLSPESLEEALRNNPEVAAVIPVHVGGLPCRMDAILRMAAEHDAMVIEDAAHCLPREGQVEAPGSQGALGVYSFYATKPITTGEGGMVVTRDGELARRMSMMRLHGIDRDVWNRYTSRDASWYYEVREPGFKYNLTDLASSLGRVQLRKSERFLQARQRIARMYLEGLAGLDYLRLPQNDPSHSWHLFQIRLVLPRLKLDRDRFVRALMERGIGVSVHFIPLHIMPYYRQTYGLKERDFPVAMQCYRETISLPIYPDLEDEQVQRVIAGIRELGDCHFTRR
ncbi:MAG: DegT/DnrJ/EryC1/StrS family aminotransferase [Spirochaetaceae bacterium]|nr:MAG: DegT/DnrJ/EryC1/StrS family aminotransferase [Spirochaetaceae bacterium]